MNSVRLTPNGRQFGTPSGVSLTPNYRLPFQKRPRSYHPRKARSELARIAIVLSGFLEAIDPMVFR
jgi:hypothetical protein